MKKAWKVRGDYMCSWYIDKGPDNDVIISSRIRLARNIKKYPFPNRFTKEQSENILSDIKEISLNSSNYIAKQFDFISLSDYQEIDKYILLEKHLVSHDLIDNKKLSGALISKDEQISIMINEEDHLRIQTILPGMQLLKAWDLSSKIDSLIEEKVEYAFDENIGYLTSCPTNVGTGMRASVMVHLPALTMIGYINGLLSTISKIGIAVRGLYGEGSKATGNLYQISNQITLGQSEEDIIESINSVIVQIMEQERMARNKILKESPFELEDKIFRSYGIFTNARMMSSNECMNLISDIKLGIDLGLINGLEQKDVNQLMVITQPGFIQKSVGRVLEGKERDVKRAEVIRKHLMKKEG